MAKPMTRKESEAKSLKIAKILFSIFVLLGAIFLLIKQTTLYQIVLAYNEFLVVGMGLSIITIGLGSVEFFADSGIVMTKRKKAMLLAKDQN